jgi:hypothetical protein
MFRSNGNNEAALTMARKQALDYVGARGNGMSIEELPREFMYMVPNLTTAAELAASHRLSFWDIDGVLLPQGLAMARSLFSVLGVQLEKLLDLQGLQKLGQGLEPDAVRMIVSKSSPRLPRNPKLAPILQDIAGLVEGAYGFSRGNVEPGHGAFQSLVNNVVSALKAPAPTSFVHTFDGPNLMTLVDKPREGAFVGQMQNALTNLLGQDLIPQMVMVTPSVSEPRVVDFASMQLRSA